MSAYSKRLNEEFEHELHIRLIEERQTFEGELAGWTARQRGIEAALEGRFKNLKQNLHTNMHFIFIHLCQMSRALRKF